ncbi:MAG: aminodeoxychorismate/anthranilate synthase component II [Marinilabiliales bacterium]|nr:MAG: aminodeoxychorismate/anthranilate synthase component II [Marinilabiliales bacterium]
MKVLIIDNYDSFTYNLVYLVQSIIKQKVDIKRNDQFDLSEISTYDKILLSPGPGIPDEAGNLKNVISQYAKEKSILGVCLGLQAISEVFGGMLENVKEVFHGIASEVFKKSNDSLFRNIPENFKAGRYHSWIVSKDKLPACFEITAEDSSGIIMALSHKSYDIKGVQFHPESLLTPVGSQIIRNWLFDYNQNTISLPSDNSKEFEIKNFQSKSLSF